MSNNRAPLSIRFFIWVVAVTLGSAGMVSSGLLHDSSAPTATSAAPVIASAGISVKVGAEESAPGSWDAAQCNPAANNPAIVGTAVTAEMLDFNCIDLLVDKYCPTVDNPATGTTDEAKGCDPDVFLPSTRWKDRLDNIMASQPGGWGNFGEIVGFSFSTMLGGFLMSIAGLLWSLIFAVANFVSSLGNLSGDVGRKVNETFVLFAQALTSSGLIALVIFITAAVMIRQVLRIRAGGMPSGIISTLMTLALPMALLFSLSTAGAKSTQVVDGKTVAVRSADPSSVFMSPVWLAQQGINLSEMPSALFGQRFSNSNQAFNKDKVVNPSCSAYTQVLAEAYKEAWKRKHPTQMSGASTAMVVNGLWNEAFMTFYNDGQFQNSFSGQRIVCHMLDGYSGISPAEQAVIAAAARYPAGLNADKVKSAFLNGPTTLAQSLASTTPTCAPDNLTHSEPYKAACYLVSKFPTMSSVQSVAVRSAAKFIAGANADTLNAVLNTTAFTKSVGVGSCSTYSAVLPPEFKTVCSILDGFPSITPAEQLSIARAVSFLAIGTAPNPATQATGSAPLATDIRYFAPYMNMNGNAGMDDKRKYVLPWAACAYKGGSATDASSWALDPAWFYGSVAADTAGNGNDKLSSAGCAKWWTTGHDDTSSTTGLSGDESTMLRYKNAKKDIIRGAQADPTAMAGMESSKTGACGTETCVAAANGVESLSGFTKTVLVTKGEIGGWLFSALMALVAACMYLYVLGGMFAGLLLAKVGFAMLLAVSPGILLLLAIPNVNGRKNSRGMKLLRMMIGWMVASALISTLIMVFALFISLIRGFIGSSGGGMMYIVSPALALVLLHFLMKAAGLGSLLSPTGALGLATGAATAAGTGNLKDMKRGQDKLRNLKKAGQDKSQKMQRKFQKLDRVRDASRNKGGKSYKDMKNEDPDWARKNSADGLVESLGMRAFARLGKRDAKKLAKDAPVSDEAAAAAAAAKEAEADAEMKEKAEGVAPNRDLRKDARANDPLQAGDQADALAATEASDGAFDRLQNIQADSDILADMASSSDEAQARVNAGENLAAGALVVGHMGPAESAGVFADSENAIRNGGPEAYKQLIHDNAASSLGLADSAGNALVAPSGQMVLGFQDPSTGALVTPHSPEFEALAAMAVFAQDSGSLTDRITHNGVEYALYAGAASFGVEGQQAAKALIAAEYGVSQADVLVNRAGTVTTIAPASGASAIPGTVMVKASSADGQVEIARNITQYFDQPTMAVLDAMPPESREVAVQTIVQILSRDGVAPDALSLVGVSEAEVRNAYAAGDADLEALLAGKTITIPQAVFKAAHAEASSVKSLIERDPANTAAVYDIVVNADRAHDRAAEALDYIEVQVESRPEQAYQWILEAMSETAVVKSAAITIDGAARHSMESCKADTQTVIQEHKAFAEMLKADYEAAQAISDPTLRDERTTKLLLEHAAVAVEQFEGARRTYNNRIERVKSSIGSSGSRAASPGPHTTFA